MRTLERPLLGNCASAPIDEGAHSIGIVGVPGDQHVEIVRQTDLPPVEHRRGHSRRAATAEIAVGRPSGAVSGGLRAAEESARGRRGGRAVRDITIIGNRTTCAPRQHLRLRYRVQLSLEKLVGSGASPSLQNLPHARDSLFLPRPRPAAHADCAKVVEAILDGNEKQGVTLVKAQQPISDR